MQQTGCHTAHTILLQFEFCLHVFFVRTVALPHVGMVDVRLSRDGQCLITDLSKDYVTLTKALKHSKPAGSQVLTDAISQCQSAFRGTIPGHLPIPALRVSSCDIA